MDGGDRGTPTSMYSIPLNCILKVVKIVNFMLCVLYHNEKRKIIKAKFLA